MKVDNYSDFQRSIHVELEGKRNSTNVWVYKICVLFCDDFSPKKKSLGPFFHIQQLQRTMFQNFIKESITSDKY